jgi:hypothetical protein
MIGFNTDLHAFLCSSDISGYHVDFHEVHSMAGARHGMCELTHDMAWERHGRGMLCESAFTVPTE